MRSVPGSSLSLTQEEVDDLYNPPDWFPEAHPPAPDVIVKGRPGAPACGSCHLMSGLGHPESADPARRLAPLATVQHALRDPEGDAV